MFGVRDLTLIPGEVKILLSEKILFDQINCEGEIYKKGVDGYVERV